MREIKFRAWLKEEKEMVIVSSIDFRIEEIYYEEQCTLASMQQAWYEFRYFNDIELMQYTGLKDNNYNEIYEGDIVELLTEVAKYGVVKFEDGAFYVECDGFRVNFYDNFRGGDVIVIGNIYENKELLNE